MAGDDAQIAQVFTKDRSSTFGKIPVGRAVEPIFADAVLLVVFVRDRVHIRFCRHGLEESRIEHRHLRGIWHELSAGSDASDRSLVMKRSKFRQFLDLRDNVIVDEG